MAKMTFNGGEENPNFKMHLKEANYIRRAKFWKKVSILSIAINISLLYLLIKTII